MKEIKELIKKLREEAKKQNERRIIVFISERSLKEIVEFLKEFLTKNSLIVGYEKIENFVFIEFKDTTKILGMTFDNAVIDIRENIHPDDLGRIIDTVRGSGLIFLIMYNFEKTLNHMHNFKKNLLYYEDETARNVFERRLINKFLESKIISIVDFDNNKVLKIGSLEKTKEEKKKIIFPKSSKIQKILYRTCLTQDQVNVLKALEDFYFSEKNVFILKANRGRGKSAALGLFLAFLVSKLKDIKICVTAPEKTNVKTLFHFFKIGCKRLKIEKKLEYEDPSKIFEKNYDLVVVDEAAAISVNILIRIAKKFEKVIFSSTVHGYEGSGRSFGIRFIEELLSNNIKFEEFEMKEPIRYSQDDEVEKFIFDLLLLNAEPCEIDKDDLEKIFLKKYEYLRISSEELFNDEELLKNFFGIYVIAHYRNRPRDLAILANSIHHFPRAVVIGKKVINSLHLCEEGDIRDEYVEKILKVGCKEIKGNIIPGIIVRHYRIPEFAKLKGIRIVRIATHPLLFSLGIGSYALKSLEEEFKNYDYIGTSFGVNEKLANFWLQNGFVPLHISAERNRVSGEYSTIWVKPLSKEAKNIVEKIYFEFKQRLIASLSDAYYDLEISVAQKLLSKVIEKSFEIKLTENQIKRFEAFYEDLLPYETISDVAKEIAKEAFLSKVQSFLNEEEQKLVIGKLFLAKGWKKLSEEFMEERKTITQKFKNALKKIWKKVYCAQ
jgi:tRNA(Met) cytidine acetyltransferase